MSAEEMYPCGILLDVQKMGDRVAWLVQEVGGGNQRELARKAGLRNSSHVGMYLKRVREKPDAEMDPDTIRSFVEHLKVNMDWLVNGKGEPFAAVVPYEPKYGLPPFPLNAPTREVETVDRYPSRAPILAAARRRGFDSEAIDVVASIRLEAEDDPGPDHWLSELKAWSRKLRELDLGEEGPAEEAEERALAAAAAARAAPPVKRR